MKNNKGFSLVELIIVIAIMAVLVGVMAPQYIKYVEKSRISTDDSNASTLLENVTTALANEDAIADLGTTQDLGVYVTFGKTGIKYASTDSLVQEIQDTLSDSGMKVQSTRSKNSSYVISIGYLSGVGYKAIGYWTDTAY